MAAAVVTATAGLRRTSPALLTGQALAAACGVIAFGVYGATAAHGATWDDGGELAAGVARLGIVHQPGYPLYVLAGWAFGAVEPFGSAALRANLWSSLTAAGAVATVAYLVMWRVGSGLGAVLAAMLLGAGELFWTQAIQASVYPMFVLSILLLLLVAYRWDQAPTPWRLAWLACITGIVTVSSREGLVFAPCVAALVIARGGRSLASVRNVAAGGAFMLPWLSAIYLPLRATASVYPNYMRGFGKSWLGLLGGNSPLQQDQLFGAVPATVAHNLLNLGLLSVAELSLAAIILVPVGTCALRRDRVFVLCGLLPAALCSALVITTSGSFPYWQLPLIAAGAFAAGCAVPAITRALAGRRLVLQLLLVGVLAAAALTGAAAGVAYVGANDPDASSWARSTLTALPQGATVRAPWPAYAPLRATQELDHFRPDVRLALFAGWFWTTGALRAAASSGSYVVSMARLGTSGEIGVTPIGPAAPIHRKGLSNLRFVGRELGDPSVGVARTYRVELCPAPTCASRS